MARQMIRSHGKSIKPLPTQPTFLASTQLDSAVTPVSTRSAAQPKVVQPKFQVLQVRSSNTPVTLSKTAFPMNALKSEPDPIHPLVDPIQSQSDTSSGRPTAQTPRQYASNETLETQLAALPRQPTSPNPYEPEDNTVDLGNLRGLFTGKVRQRISNAKYYPRIARRRGMEGRPIVAFTLDKNGRLLQAALAQTSGYQLLDQAALEAVQQAAPYPEIPAPLKMDSFQFKLPISFILK
jgi:TonB family protein